MTKDEYEELHRMTKEEFECLRKDGYLSSPGEILYANGIPIAIYDPVSPMDCRRKIEYSSADERTMLYHHDSPANTFDPVSPMDCQSKQIAYDMAELANLTNAYCSALHTVQAAKMDDISNHFAQVAYNMAETPYNETKRESYTHVNAKREGLIYVPLKPKNALEDFWDSLDGITQIEIEGAMWTSFVCGVMIPFCIMWLICDELLPFF